LHIKFEELYTDANLKVDEIAERILTLGETPLHTFEDYSKLAKVPVGKNISQDEKAVRLIVDSLSELLQIERSILDKSGEANDEGFYYRTRKNGLDDESLVGRNSIKP